MKKRETCLSASIVTRANLKKFHQNWTHRTWLQCKYSTLIWIVESISNRIVYLSKFFHWNNPLFDSVEHRLRHRLHHKKPLVFFLSLLKPVFRVSDFMNNLQLITMWMTIGEKTEMLLAFSFYTNGRRLFCCKESSSSDVLSCLHGIRVITTLWIVLGHTFLIFVMLPNQNLIAIPEVSAAIHFFWVKNCGGNAKFLMDFFYIFAVYYEILCDVHRLWCYCCWYILCNQWNFSDN